MATILEVGGIDRSALLRDLSVTGAMFLTRAKPDLGEVVTLRIYLDSDDGETPLRLEGSVVRFARWPSDSYWPYSVAVQFTQSADEHIDRIRAISQRQAEIGLLKP